MNCCSYTQKADAQFGEARAEEEARQYRNKGLNSHSRAMVKLVGEKDIQGTTLLEIGSGVGAVTIELLKRGVERAVNVEASRAYLEAAQTLAGQTQFLGRVAYHCADFAQGAGSLSPVDIVVMHRVVCCYPNPEALVKSAAQHARRFLAVSYPVDAWYMHLHNSVKNLFLRMEGSAFRHHIHTPQIVFDAASASGFRPVKKASSGVWRLVLFERITE